MNKFVVFAYNDNDAVVKIDRETQEHYLDVPEDAYIKVVIEADNFDDAKQLFFNNSNYTDDVCVACIVNSATEEYQLYS